MIDRTSNTLQRKSKLMHVVDTTHCVDPLGSQVRESPSIGRSSRCPICSRESFFAGPKNFAQSVYDRAESIDALSAEAGVDVEEGKGAEIRRVFVWHISAAEEKSSPWASPWCVEFQAWT